MDTKSVADDDHDGDGKDAGGELTEEEENAILAKKAVRATHNT